MVITTAQLHSTKPELRFCTASNPARSVSEIRDGGNLWQCPLLEIRLNVFRRSTIPQKQSTIIFIIIIMIVINDFIHFKLIISNIIKIVEFLIFKERQFVLVTNRKKYYSILISFSTTWIFVCSIFLTTDTIGFHHFYILHSTEVSGYFITSFISFYSLNTLFTETNSSWLIYESIKALEIRTSKLFKLSFPNNAIWSCFFFFLFIIYLYLLTSAVIARICIPTVELVIPAYRNPN